MLPAKSVTSAYGRKALEGGRSLTERLFKRFDLVIDVVRDSDHGIPGTQSLRFEDKFPDHTASIVRPAKLAGLIRCLSQKSQLKQFIHDEREVDCLVEDRYSCTSPSYLASTYNIVSHHSCDASRLLREDFDALDRYIVLLVHLAEQQYPQCTQNIMMKLEGHRRQLFARRVRHRRADHNNVSGILSASKLSSMVH